MNGFLAGAVFFAPAPDPTQSTHPLLPAGALAQSTSERPDSAQRTPVDQEPRPEGRNYVEGQHGAAGGVPSGTADAPGGASTEGTAGKGAQAQPDKKPSSGPRENEQQR